MVKRHLDYTIDGVPVPGVTSFACTDKSNMIMGWCYKLTKAGRNPYAERNEAKDYGSTIHDLIFQILHGQSIAADCQHKPVIDNFFKMTKGWKWLGGEFRIFNRGNYGKIKLTEEEQKEVRYAGTIDHLFVIDGVRTLVDIKTSNSVYPINTIQLAAYKLGTPEQDKEYIADFEKVEKCLILHLNKEGGVWDWYDRTPQDADIQAVLDLRRVYNWRKLRGDLG